jgi:hypothetical protein
MRQAPKWIVWVVAAALAADSGPSKAGKRPAARKAPPRQAARAGAARQGELLRKHLAGAMAGCEEIVFAVRSPGRDPHWYANFGHWSSDPTRMMYGLGGAKLCKLNLRTKKLTVLLDDPQGSIRDPAVHYDGRKVLFSYRRGGTRYYNLYEMDLSSGRPPRLRRITDAPFDDIEACYLPGGDIAFCSSRCNRWVQCWHTQVAILYRCDADGGNIRPISSNVEHDNTPAVLPDGRLLYTRWEYVDRSQVDFHHLWTVNPDGTGQMTYFGNMHPRMLMIDARPIPPRPGSGQAGTGKVAAIFSPGHGRNEHQGDLMILTPDRGPDSRGAARPVAGCPKNIRDPYPFSEDCFLVARRHQLLLVGSPPGPRAGAPAGALRSEVLYQLDEKDRRRGLQLHEPRAIRPRRRERVLPDRVDPKQATGTFVMANVTHGRRMEGVRPGEIKKLLVLESLPKPVNFSGGPEPLSYLGTFTLERVLGTVPVEPDGSAYFELPANRALFFVALDANDLSVKRMQSFVSVMPGETTGCVGCHEPRTETSRFNGRLAALRRAPSKVQPFKGFPDVVDFPRDVQPILDKHCVKCHDYEKRSGRVILTGDRGPKYSHSYWSLFAHGQVVDGRNAWSNNAPRTIGSSASPLMKKIAGGHYKVKVSPRERRMIWLWLESGAAYPGTYAALLTGMTAVDVWAAGPGVLRRRCAQCHYPPQKGRPPVRGKIALPAGWQAPRRNSPPHERWAGKYHPATARSSHILVNLTHPANSTILKTPLAQRHGGWAIVKANPTEEDNSHSIVFESTRDPDYQKLLAHIRLAKQHLERIRRFDMPGFRPNVHYIREMKFYGILPKEYNAAKDPIDVYKTDRAYWRSFWHVPGG